MTGRRIDLVETHGVGPVHDDYVLDSDRRAFTHLLVWASVVYSEPVTLTVDLLLKSRLGVPYDVPSGSAELQNETTAIFYGVDLMYVTPGDFFQITAPDGGVDITAAVQIHEQIFP